MDRRLLAFCLGDGCITKRRVLQIRHCKKQKEYLEWKLQELNSIIKCYNIYNGIQNGFEYYEIYSSQSSTNTQKLQEIYDKLYLQHGKKYFSKDNNQDLIRKYNIRSIPTLIFLNEDQEYNRLVGNQSYATINKIINYDTI